MTNETPSLSPVMHEIQVNVVSAEEASFGVAELWSGDRMIGFTLIEDGDLALRIEPCPDPVVVGAHALARALAEADRLLALH
jgi:hypothetical protein